MAISTGSAANAVVPNALRPTTTPTNSRIMSPPSGSLRPTHGRNSSGLKHGRTALYIYICCCAAVNSRTTIMRIPGFLIALMLLVSSPVHADPPKAAVFDFELLDTRLQGDAGGPR